MTSRSLFCKLMKEDLKQRLWSVILAAIVFLIIPVTMALELENNHVYADNTRFLRQVANVVTASPWLVIITCVGSVLCGLSGFWYLFSKKKVDFFHSLPVKREVLFAVRYINGVLIYVVPYLCALAVSLIMAAANDAFPAGLFGDALAWFGFYLCSYLVFYTITIIGVGKLGSVEHTPIADRIIAGTYLLATATCGGEVLVKNVDYEHIYSLITKLKNAGCMLNIKNDKIKIISKGRLKSFGSFETLPYPGFPTDLQPQGLVLQTLSEGTCIVAENLFETRFKHVPELVKMGANIVTRDRMAIVTGVEKLYGAEVNCSDLRAGAALTIAGMVAEGKTILNDIHNIDRGYEKLEEAFCSLGAEIKRVKN